MSEPHLERPSEHEVKEEKPSPLSFSYHDEKDQSRYHQSTDYRVPSSREPLREHDRTPAREIERSRGTNQLSRDEMVERSNDHVERSHDQTSVHALRSRDQDRGPMERSSLMERLHAEKRTSHDRFIVSPHADSRASHDQHERLHESAYSSRLSPFDRDAFFQSRISRRHHAPERPRHSPPGVLDHSENRERSLNGHDRDSHVSHDRRRQDRESEHENHPPKVFIVEENKPQTMTHTTGSSPTPPSTRDLASTGSKHEYTKQEFSPREHHESKSARGKQIASQVSFYPCSFFFGKSAPCFVSISPTQLAHNAVSTFILHYLDIIDVS